MAALWRKILLTLSGNVLSHESGDLRDLPDQTSMAAITFSDVVVSHHAFTDGLLFHELVHVEQYRQLGIPRFAELYVRGFLTGGGYDGIPLEVNAYSLGARFEANPQQKFSVGDARLGSRQPRTDIPLRSEIAKRRHTRRQ